MGVIKLGLYVDFLVVKGDLFKDICMFEYVDFVMKGGYVDKVDGVVC